ncbi:hypothetical protein ACHWQZ_G010625 [Mnemiopsis leidyi]
MLCLSLLLFVGLYTAVPAKPDPECYMTPTQIGERYGYTMEEHWPVTDDGYILMIHRVVAKSKGAPVVFLQHGLLDSSATWLLNGKEGSFAFVLADAGYDVWLGNVRGNTYTKNHTTLSVDSDAFWAFTFDEMAALDLPNMIDYVLNKTGQESVFYFGHSQGSIIGFTGFSNNAVLAKKIKLFTALAPVARVDHVQGLFHYLSMFQSSLEWIWAELGVRQFLPSNWFLRTFATMVCPHQLTVCSNMIFLMAGFDTSNLNQTRVPIYESHCPAGSSTRNLVHWSQMINAKKLQKYDYESVTKNMLHYGSPYPPQYNISGLSVPTVLVMGGNDWLGDPRDELWLIEQIGHTIKSYFTIDYYNHLDFLWGEDAVKMVYRPVIALMDSMV